MTNEEAPVQARVNETVFETIAGWCSLLVVYLFIVTFLAQNFVIPSGSMENTLLVGDHLLVDRLTLASDARWMPLVHYREPRRGDLVVFIKPVADYPKGQPEYPILVKRLIGVPGDRIRLNHGIVSINGIAQSPPREGKDSPTPDKDFVDEFPSVLPTPGNDHGATETWTVDLPSHIRNGELVVPPGMYFMMGDHRHGSLDSRYWGFVPRENIMGRPLFNYWSFETPKTNYDKTGIGNSVAWMGHVVLHFFTGTRWKRTLYPTR